MNRSVWAARVSKRLLPSANTFRRARNHLLVRAALGLLPMLLIGGERPDLSGTYDISTLTPLIRPGKYGTRMTLADEEAAAVVQAEMNRRQKDAGSGPDRAAPPIGGDGTQGSVGSYNQLWFARGDGPFKIDGRWRSSIITDPPNGHRPPLTANGKRRAALRARLSQKNTGTAWWLDEGLEHGPYDGPESRPVQERCLLAFGSSSGPPALPVGYNNLKRIVQTEDHVMILNEMVNDARVVRLNAEHAPPDVQKWLGDSVGRWEGDTLVVDTTNFNDTPALVGASRNLHVIERFTRVDDKTLVYKFTVEDPSIWSSSWSGEYLWPASDQRVYEYACHEANYSLEGILRGARVLEKERTRQGRE